MSPVGEGHRDELLIRHHDLFIIKGLKRCQLHVQLQQLTFVAIFQLGAITNDQATI